jgi:type IV pilus assembly protein PilQ
MNKLITTLCIGLAALAITPAFSDEYKGEPMSLNFTDAETAHVLRIIAKFSKKGLILPDSELGKITIYVKNTPWDEILYGISESEGFSYKISDSVITILNTKCN